MGKQHFPWDLSNLYRRYVYVLTSCANYQPLHRIHPNTNQNNKDEKQYFFLRHKKIKIPRESV